LSKSKSNQRPSNKKLGLHFFATLIVKLVVLEFAASVPLGIDIIKSKLTIDLFGRRGLYRE